MVFSFKNADGKYVFIDVHDHGHVAGVKIVLVEIYPVGGEKYSSFIQTKDSEQKILDVVENIGISFLCDGFNGYSSQYIQNKILKHLVVWDGC